MNFAEQIISFDHASQYHMDAAANISAQKINAKSVRARYVLNVERTRNRNKSPTHRDVPRNVLVFVSKCPTSIFHVTHISWPLGYSRIHVTYPLGALGPRHLSAGQLGRRIHGTFPLLGSRIHGTYCIRAHWVVGNIGLIPWSMGVVGSTEPEQRPHHPSSTVCPAFSLYSPNNLS
jgi:hypothetical protein